VALVLERGRTVSRDELADRLWPTRLPPTWDAAVRNVITRLRQTLATTAFGNEEVIVSTGDGYQARLPDGTVVDIEDAAIDVEDAQRLLALGQPAAASARLRNATATLAAPVLPGLEGAWVDLVRARCHALRIRALEDLASASLAEERPRDAVAIAQEAVALAPLHESAHRLLMRAHARSGNRADALRAYSRCRQTLVEELGVGPDAETEHMYLELLLAGDPAEGDALEPPDHGDAVGGDGAPAGDLVGRERELDELCEAIGAARVVTISGPGGVGKTRLATAVADAVARNFQGEVHWVGLASVDDVGVTTAIANAVGGSAIGVGALDGVIAALQGTAALIVLDNCEHVLDEVARAAGELVRSSRKVRLLATSRAPLGVGGERVVRLSPLELPATDDPAEIIRNPAVALFVRRATDARASFTLEPDMLPAVIEICRRLDGMPLAIELAASQVRLLPVDDIAARLDDRFRLLQSTRRDVDPRHQSLDRVIEWSYELLAKEERDLFDRLVVFPASFSLEAAHAVVSSDGDEVDTLRVLGGLVDQSVVVTVANGSARYSMLESVREYGRRRPSAAVARDDAERRMRDHALRLAEQAAGGVRSADEAAWVRRVDSDLPSITASFRVAVAAGDVDWCLRLTVALFDYAFHRIRHEVGVLAADAVALPGAEQHPLYGEACAVAGYLAWQRGLPREAEGHLAAALGTGETWVGQDALGTMRVFQGDVQRATEAYDRAAALTGGDPYLQAITQSQRTFAAVYGGRSDGPELAALSEAAAADAANPTASAHAAWATGIVLMETDPAFALLRFERCMELSRKVGNRLAHGAASVPAQELRTRLERRSTIGDVRAALDEITYMHRTGSSTTQGVVLRRLVWGLADLELVEHAVVIAGADARASLNLPMRPREGTRHAAVLAALSARLGAEEYQRFHVRGTMLSDEELLQLLRTVAVDVDRKAQRRGSAAQ
jgi:predicted ATPase/DNA-binding SARP family transcriptional activator